MIAADVNFFHINEIPTDRYTERLGEPEYDICFGALDNIINATVDASTYSYTWTRPIDANDGIYDQVYTKGKDIQLLWACGQCDDEGNAMLHEKEDRGKFNITLSDEFEYECSTNFLQFNSN